MRKLLVIVAIALAIGGCTGPGSSGAPAGSSGPAPYGY
jgi:hypothetical protein